MPLPARERPPVRQSAPVPRVETIAHQEGLTAEDRKKVIQLFEAQLVDLRESPEKIFETRIVSSFDEDTGEIILHAENILSRISIGVGGKAATFSNIVDHLKSIGNEISGFSFLISPDAHFYVIKLVGAQDLIKKGKEARERKIDTDYGRLMTIIETRLNEVNGMSLGLSGSSYFRFGDRILLRKWPDEVKSLFYVLKERNAKFQKEMADAGYPDAKFGYEDDGGMQRYWIELSWREAATE